MIDWGFFGDLTIRLSVALVLGGLIGLEREYRAKEAGFRTHFLVALGSALFCIVSQYGFGAEVKDASRVAAQVVSGIGFLGAGTIIFYKNVVRGLTTAAGLWVTAAIGLACGTGMYGVAVISTVLILFGLEVLNAMIPQIGTTIIDVKFIAKSKDSVRQVLRQLKADKVEVFSYELRDKHTSDAKLYEVVLELKVKKVNYNERIMHYMEEFDDVTISSIE